MARHGKIVDKSAHTVNKQRDTQYTRHDVERGVGGDQHHKYACRNDEHGDNNGLYALDLTHASPPPFRSAASFLRARRNKAAGRS